MQSCPRHNRTEFDMPDQPETVWQPKDFVLLIPLLASSLAISWEVGKFFPSGGFSFFTLSEHFLAAMVALPVALVVTFFFAFSFATLGPIARRMAAKSPRWALIVSLLAIAIGLAIPGAVEFHKRGELDSSTVVVDLALLLFVANAFWPKHKITGPIGLLFVFGTSILVSISLSADLSWSNIRRAEADANILSDIITKSDTSKAYVIMAGERGILSYSPDSKRFRFQRSDEIQGLEWQRH
jgi:hypothetical protein